MDTAMQAVLGDTNLLAKILCLLPLCKPKVKMQLVNKTWKACLETSEAHSLDVSEEDCKVPYSGHVPDRREGMEGLIVLFMSRSILNVLPHLSLGYKSHSDLSTLAWLPTGLQSLKGSLDSVNYPKLPDLKRLAIRQLDYFHGVPDKVFDFLDVRMPKLEVLDWYADNLCPNLQRLQQLRELKFSVCDLPEGADVGQIPSGCNVTYTWWSDHYNFPVGMAGSVKLLRCLHNDAKNGLNFQIFEGCSVLEGVSVHNCGLGKVQLKGFRFLPASCTTVEVFPAGAIFDDEDLVFLVTSGWRVGIGPRSTVICR